MTKNTAKRQIHKLLLLDGMNAFMIAGASWVALLAARGYSMLEIGLLESIFHVASMSFEIPSGAIADVFGRKKTMVASQMMNVLASIVMIFSHSFVSISIAMIFSAFSYNLASGSREALAYDSLKSAGDEEDYEKFAANDMVIYDFAMSFATLMAGVTLLLGYQKAYAIDVIAGVSSILVAWTLLEAKVSPEAGDTQEAKVSPEARDTQEAKVSHEASVSQETKVSPETKKSVVERFVEVAKESYQFLRENRRCRRMIIFNATIGALAVLVVFFAQALLPELGMQKVLLGPALFALNLGSVAGAKAENYLPKMSYKKTGLLSVIGVSLAVLSILTNQCWLIIAGGFVGSFADSLIEVKTDVELNRQIPSEQRATLMSVNSFTYSVVMIILSPIFGSVIS